MWSSIYIPVIALFYVPVARLPVAVDEKVINFAAALTGAVVANKYVRDYLERYFEEHACSQTHLEPESVCSVFIFCICCAVNNNCRI